MKKSGEASRKEKEQDFFPVEDVFSELPPPIPLDALPDPLADPVPVKETPLSEKKEGEEKEEGEEGESSGKKALSKSKVVAIVTGVLLAAGVITWASISKFGKKKTEESDSSTPTSLVFYIEDGQVLRIDEQDYYVEDGSDPEEMEAVDAIINSMDFVQSFDEIAPSQLESIERISIQAFRQECEDMPETLQIISQTPSGICLISKGQNAPVSSVAMIYQIDIDDYSGDVGDPNSYEGSYTFYWCVEFPGVFTDGSMLENVYEVQQYSSCLIGKEEWEVHGFYDIADLFVYLTSQGNDVQVMNLAEIEGLKYISDKPQFFSSIQSKSIAEDVRNSIKVEILTELASFQYAEVNSIHEEQQLFMVYTDESGKQRNMVIAPYSVHILEKNGQEEQLYTYYRAFGVMDLYVGAEPTKGVYWNDVESMVELSENLSLIGYESEEALIARLYELFPDAQIWRIDMNAPRHIKDLLTPPKQKS